MKKKRGQAWGFDAMIAAVIFSAGVITFYLFALNYSAAKSQIVEDLTYDANNIADSILSEGLPTNWNESVVTKIGILSDDKINNTKVAQFYNLSIEKYPLTKSQFNTRFDYFFNLSEPLIINNVPVTGIGHPPVNAKNVVRVTHFSAYNNKPVTVYILTWA